jgi:sigma-B regulation protein RsbU (phosphoserine phosphatase)
MEWSSTVAAQSLGPEIVERRRRLVLAAGQSSARAELDALIVQFDAALARIESGTYGLCETCNDPIEQDRLQADPLVRFCLDHLNENELRAHERDLELAGQIQTKLLPPRHLRLAGCETHYVYQAAGPVGGDYCELIPSTDGRSLFFAIGDVSGKGVAASLLMTHLSAILRSLHSLDLPIPDVMARANLLFCESTITSHYATLICGRLTADGTGEIANAGHCRPAIVRRDSVEPVQAEGLPLGLFSRAVYPAIPFRLAAREALVLYTDGLTEGHDGDGREFGESRLLESIRTLLSRNPKHDATALVTSIGADGARFRQGAPLSDDLTIIAIRQTF